MSENMTPAANQQNKPIPKYLEIAHYIAAGCFGLCALGCLINLVSFFSVFTLLYLALFGVAAYACLKKEISLPLLPGAFAGLALIKLIEMIETLIRQQLAAKANGYYGPSNAASTIITSLIVIFAYLCMLAFALVRSEKTGIAFVDSLGSKLQAKAQTFEKLWFVPAAARLLSSVVGLFSLFSYCYFGRIFGGYGLVEVAALLFTAMWLLMPASLINAAQKSETSRSASAAAGTAAPADAGYIDLVKHILLLLFTFGVWNFIWIYRSTGYLNRVKGEEYRNPTTKLLLCMFVPFYSIYWTYMSAQRVDKLAAEQGVSSDLTTPCLIMAIFVFFATPIVLQEKINSIISSANAPAAGSAKSAAGADVENLMKFKELLDSGVITQEDFDAKKKQLLGL